MLRELRINNVAIIDQMRLGFAPGLNVLTGETGAGKSIITRAIALLCGARASADLLRTEADEAEIEGLFDADGAVRAVLEELGLPDDEDLIIRRVISRTAKGKVTINGSLSTASVLARLGDHLIHVYGQHDYALLLKPESHLAFLDDYGDHDAETSRMAAAYESFREADERLRRARSGVAQREQRLDLLRFQADELAKARPAVGEVEQLRVERERHRHADKLARICQEADEALSTGDQAIANALGRIAASLDEAGRLDADFGTRAAGLRDALAQVEDVALELRRAGESIDADPARLEEIEDRLALYGRLERKYGCDADELAVRLEAVEDELRELEAGDADIEALEEDRERRAGAAWTAAQALSARRRASAEALEEKLAAEVATLGMAGAVVRVVFHSNAEGTREDDRLGPAGADEVEFYLSANPGEEPRPLARIASGGELSRVMLALKALTAGAGEVATLIFDEVDAGIGGATAEAVGQRLHALARHRQLLSITHLPQIAALADHHLAIAKHVRDGRTVTSARELDEDERVAELGRMLGAGGSDESALYARRLMAARRA